MLTIARGTLPLVLFGSTAYGLRQGRLVAPSRLLQAAAPLLFGLIIDSAGAFAALALSTALSLSALAALLALRPAPTASDGPAGRPA